MRSSTLASGSFASLTVLVALVAIGCVAPSTAPIGRGNAAGAATTPESTVDVPKTSVDDLPAASPAAPVPTGGTEVGSETWKDGKQLAASVTVKTSETVDIEPGATVTAAAGTAITVKGTLTVKAAANHAKLVGTNWKGIVVAAGGSLVVDGLDIDNAEFGVWAMTGNAEATFLNSSISNASVPIKMEPGAKVSFTKSKVVNATGSSVIAGTFTASYMDYDKGTAGGLELSDPAGSMTISDSTLRGVGGSDYIVSRAGKLVKIEYSTITGSHCGLHFSSVDQFIIDHVSDDQNTYGAMLYGSGAGPNQIISSNIRSTQTDLDMSGTNGALTIDKSFTGGKNALQPNARISNAANAAITNAKPR